MGEEKDFFSKNLGTFMNKHKIFTMQNPPKG